MKVLPAESVTVKHPGSPAGAEVVGGWVVVGGTSEDEGDGVSDGEDDADPDVEGDGVPLSVVIG